MVPSLGKLCGVPSMVVLLNHPHVKKEIFSLSKSRENYSKWHDALHKVMSKILEDYNPKLKEIIPRYLTPVIGLDMVNFAECLQKCLNLSFTVSQNIFKISVFTSNGLIDEQKAARELVKEPSFSTFLKYKIACEYFLEDIVPGLWQELQNNEPYFKKCLEEYNSETPMVMWSDFLNKISTSLPHRKSIITLKFKERIFVYGLKNKNVAAVKYSFDPKWGFGIDVNLSGNPVLKSYCDYVDTVFVAPDSFYGYSVSLYCPHALADRNIIMYFISLMNKKEFKFFVSKFDFSYKIGKWFLLWPYRYPFMEFAHILFENLDVEKYADLMSEIILLTGDQHMSEYYNYRLLVREFWIKSPSHLKEEIIICESRDDFDLDDLIFYTNLITISFIKSNFIAVDLKNVNLILGNTNSRQRKNILLLQGEEILDCMIYSRGSFSMANLFFKTMDLDQETIETFKKDFLLETFDCVMRKKDMNFVEEIFKWVIGSDEIDDFKDEFFHQLTNSNKIEYLFNNLKEEIPFSFLNKILKWFLKTDENIKEWEEKIEYSPLIKYKNPAWFNQLLKYRGYCYEETLDFKRELLYGKLPEIARLSLDYANVEEFLDMNVFYLCLFKKEKFQEFIDHLRSFFKNSIEEKVCLFCLNNNLVHGNGGEGELHCEEHGLPGFISYDNIDQICSPFFRQIAHLLQVHELILKSDRRI